MRIAFYAPLKPPDHVTPSGDRQMARLLIDALELAGHEVFLASTLRSYERDGNAGKQAEIARAGRAEALRLVAGWRRVPASERPEAWFTYHLYHKAPDHLGPWAAAQLNIPYVVAEASHAPKQAGGPWAHGFRHAERAIRQARAVLCLTRRDMAGVAPLVVAPNRLVQLPPFLEPTVFSAAAERAAQARIRLARELDLDPGLGWLLAVGMMRDGDKLQSYRILGAALARLAGEDWRLLVVGDGAAADRVRSALAASARRVRYLGYQPRDRLAEIYAASDIYVWPAVGEAYGMALLEAQAAGLPVVAGDERGVPDVVRDGETGILTRPGDGADLALQLRRLLDDDALRARLGRNARRFVAEERTTAGAAAILDGTLKWARESF